MESSVQQAVEGWKDSGDSDRHVTEPKAVAAPFPLNGDHSSAFSGNNSSQQQHKNSDQGASSDVAKNHPAIGDDGSSQRQQRKSVVSPDSAIDLTVCAEDKAFSSSAIENQSAVLSSDAEAPGKESTVECDADSHPKHNSSSSEALASGNVGVENGGADRENRGCKEQQDFISRDATAAGFNSPGQPVSEAEDVPAVPGVDSEVEVAETVEVEDAVAGILDVDVEVSEDVEVEMEVPAANCTDLGEVSAGEVVVESASGDGDGEGSAFDIVENVVDIVDNIESTVDVVESEEIVDDQVAHTVDVVDYVETTDDDVKNVEVNDDNLESAVDVGNSVEIDVAENVEVTDSTDVAGHTETTPGGNTASSNLAEDEESPSASVETTIAVTTVKSDVAEDAETSLAEPASGCDVKEDTEAAVVNLNTMPAETAACSNIETTSGDAGVDRVEQNGEEAASKIVQGDDDDYASLEVEGSSAVETSLNTTCTAEDSSSCQEVKSNGKTIVNHSPSSTQTYAVEEVSESQCTAQRDSEEVRQEEAASKAYSDQLSECDAEQQSGSVRVSEEGSEGFEIGTGSSPDCNSGHSKSTDRDREGTSVDLKGEGHGDGPQEHSSGGLEIESVADKHADDDKEGDGDAVKPGVPDNKADEGLSNKGNAEDSEDEADKGVVHDETVDKHRDEKLGEVGQIKAYSLPAADTNRDASLGVGQQAQSENTATSPVGEKSQPHIHSKSRSPDTMPVGAETSNAGTTFHRSGSREFGNIFEKFTNAEDIRCYSPATPNGEEGGKHRDKQRNGMEKSPDRSSTADLSSMSETVGQSRQSKRKGGEDTSDEREPRPKRRRLSEDDGSKPAEMMGSESTETEETIKHSGAKKVRQESSLKSTSIDNKESDGEGSKKHSKTTWQGEAREAGKELSTLSDSDESAGEDDENDSESDSKHQSMLKGNEDKDSDTDEEEDRGTSSENSDGDEDNDNEDKMKESKTSPSGTVALGNEERNIARKTDDSTGSQGEEGRRFLGNVSPMDLDQSLGSCSDDSSDLSDGLNELLTKIKPTKSVKDATLANKVPAAEKPSFVQNMNEGTQADFSDSDSEEELSDEDDIKSQAVSDDSGQQPQKISASNSRNMKEGTGADPTDESDDLSDEGGTEIQLANVKNAASRVKTSGNNEDHNAGVTIDKTPQEKTQSNSSGDHSTLDTKQKSKEVEGQKACNLNEERGANSGETDKKGEATTDVAGTASSTDETEKSPVTSEVHFSRVKNPKTYSRQVASHSLLARTTTKLSKESVRKVSDVTEMPLQPRNGSQENGETVKGSDLNLAWQVQETHMVQDPSKSKPSIISRITKALKSSAHSPATAPTPRAAISTPPAPPQAATKLRSVTRPRPAKATVKVSAVQGSSIPMPGSRKTQGQTKAASKVKVGSQAAPTKADLRQQARKSTEQQGSGKKQQGQLKKTGDSGGVAGGVGGVSSSGGSEHKCSLCGRTFAALDRFRKHKKAHALGKNFCCKTCGKLFSSEEKMVTHKLVHQQSSTGTFTCTICGEVCQNWRPFLYHLSKHSANGGKKYTCDICGHTLFSADRLRRHTKAHKQGCNFCCYTCGKLFFSQERLDKHTPAHSGKSATTTTTTTITPTGRGSQPHLSTYSSEDQSVSRLAAGKGSSPVVTEAALPRATRKRLEEEADGRGPVSPGGTKEISHQSLQGGESWSAVGSRESVAAKEGMSGGTGELSPDTCQLRKSSRKRKHSRQRCACCRGSPVSKHQPSLSFPGPNHKRRELEKDHERMPQSGVAGSDGMKREWDQSSLKECSVKLERSPQLTSQHRVSPEAHSLLKAVKLEIPSVASKSVKAEVISPTGKPIKSEMSSHAGKFAKPEAFSAPSPIAPAPEDQSLPATTTTTTPTTALPSHETPKRPPKKAKWAATEPFEGRKVKIYRTASAKMLPKNLALSNASRERSRKGPREKAASKPEPDVATPPLPPSPQASSTPKRLFPCGICGESFPSDSAAKIHIGKHLTNTPPKKVVVDIESVARSCHLSYSQGSASPEGGYSCHRCGYVARAYADLSKHMWMHSRKEYQCTECCASFSLAETLQHHMKAHSKGKTPPQHSGKGKNRSSQRSR